MKKNLLLSSALVAAGLFVAGDAFAQAKPMTLSVGGYYHTYYQYTKQKDSRTGLPAGAVAQGGANRVPDALYYDGEIIFTGRMTLDNGLQVGLQVELEMDNQNDQWDEMFLDLRGSFGRVVLGQFDGAAREMQRVAPSGSRSYLNGINEWGFLINPITGGGYMPGTSSFNAGDAEKIVYFSPVFSGFQFGLSYAPNGTENAITQAGGALGPGTPVTAADNGNTLGAYWDIAATYNGKFGDVGVAAGVGYQQAKVRNLATLYRGANNFNATINLDPVDSYLGHLIFSVAGFDFGGTFSIHERTIKGLATGAALPAGTRRDVTDLHYDLGVAYTTGPWRIGATYFGAKQESEADSTGGANPTLGGALKSSRYLLNASYLLGPGLTVESGLAYEKLDFSGSQPDQTGTTFYIGTRLGF